MERQEVKVTKAKKPYLVRSVFTDAVRNDDIGRKVARKNTSVLRLSGTVTLLLAVLFFFVNNVGAACGWNQCDWSERCGANEDRNDCMGSCSYSIPSTICYNTHYPNSNIAVAYWVYGGCRSYGNTRYVYPYGDIKYLYCSTQTEADSARCVLSGNDWNSDSTRCDLPCDAQCQCERSGGTWKGSFCVPQCETRYCCDSLNQNLPVQTDTLWLGCVATDPQSDRCVVYDSGVTPGDTTLNATCNGKSRYRVCVQMYMWSQGAGQCGLLPTTNCAEYDVQDSMCSNVVCSRTQQHELSALDYDHLTQCYTGTETVRNILICSNGLREPGGDYTRQFQVCKPFLDSLGIGIDDYISGGSGASGYGWGGSSGGGVAGGGGYGGDSNGNGMGDAYQGGPGVDANGDSVYNSPSPGLGGNWSPQPQVVTEVDSNGNIQIVKNSQGGDSIRVDYQYNEVRCLGVFNGIATLTNGLNTWTCEASSCSQAILSSSIFGGACSTGKNGVLTSETNPSLPVVAGDSSWYQSRFVEDLDKLLEYVGIFNANVNSNSILDRRQRDSILDVQKGLWQSTFGDDYSNVSGIKDGVSGIQSVNSQGFSDVVGAINSASSVSHESINSAASANRNAIYSAASDVVASTDRVRVAVNSNTSSVENVRTAVNTQGQNVVDAINAMASASSNVNGVVDTLHNTNQMMFNIERAVSDTGKGIPASIWSLDSTVYDLPMRFDSLTRESLIEWSNDKLVIMMDTNVGRVVNAIESLKVDVKLDSISFVVEHQRDTILDSINDNLKTKGNYTLTQQNDTLDFEKMFRKGFDSALVDTSYNRDTSFMGFFHSVDFVDSSAFSGDGNVDSITNEVNRKLDSSQAAHNLRSDSLTRAYLDTMSKYSGIDSTSAALRRLFNQQNNGCPKDCIDISLDNPFVSGGRVEIKFSTYICDMKIFGQLSVLDFIKFILRLMTAILSTMMIWSAVGKRKDTST